MKNVDINLIQLEAVAAALGELLPHVTFVGGSTTVLLVDEAAHFGVRKTDDVDVIIDVATLVEYHTFHGVCVNSASGKMLTAPFAGG